MKEQTIQNEFQIGDLVKCDSRGIGIVIGHGEIKRHPNLKKQILHPRKYCEIHYLELSHIDKVFSDDWRTDWIEVLSKANK